MLLLTQSADCNDTWQKRIEIPRKNGYLMRHVTNECTERSIDAWRNGQWLFQVQNKSNRYTVSVYSTLIWKHENDADFVERKFNWKQKKTVNIAIFSSGGEKIARVEKTTWKKKHWKKIHMKFNYVKKNPKRSASFVRISVRLRLEPFLSSSIDRVCVNFCMCLLLNENTTESQTNIQP